MIYLFEDRFHRMQQYLKDEDAKRAIYEGKYIKHVQFSAETKENLDYHIQSEFQDAKVVLFHGTYKLPNNITVSDVKSAFTKNQVDFTSFSGGSNAGNYFPVGNHYEGSINSAVMYENLPFLIKRYEQEGRPDVRLLFFGEEFLKNELLLFEKLIKQYLSDFHLDEKIFPEYVQEIKDKIVDPYLNDPDFEGHKEKINEWLTKKIKNPDNGVGPESFSKVIDRMKSQIL